MYKLSHDQEYRFEKICEKYQDKIKLAIYKCNIRKDNYDYFYSFALEGLLQSFLILEAGDITEKEFSAFVFINMKRKIIDELRRLSRYKDTPIVIEESYSNLSYREDKIEEFILIESLKKELSVEEKVIFNLIEKGYTYKQIQKMENISKSKYYNFVSAIKSKYYTTLYK